MELIFTLKYLGIDNKLKVSAHISYVAERLAKLIQSLSKSAKVSGGLKHVELQTIYKGVILPLLQWSSSLDRSYAVRTQQTKIHPSATDEYKIGQNVTNDIKRGIVHVDRNDAHNY